MKRHSRRTQRSVPNWANTHVGWCEQHSKCLYRSRKAAKRVIRLHPDDGHKRAYACEVFAGNFHVGHLPSGVVAGQVTATELYGGDPA